MRVMIDTNVFISIIFFPTANMNELKRRLSNEHRIVLCTQIIAELLQVTKRKFPSRFQIMDAFFADLPYELVNTPDFIEAEKFPVIRDKWDYPILISAIISDTDILITGDKDFDDVDIRRPEILTPSEFLAKY